MSRGPAVRQADVTRAVKALEAAGLTVARVQVRAGGVVDIIPGPPPTADLPDAALTPAAAANDGDGLDAWRARRRAAYPHEGS